MILDDLSRLSDDSAAQRSSRNVACCLQQFLFKMEEEIPGLDSPVQIGRSGD